ncbi:MAG: nitrous oxide reductase [Bacteroidetes bacterium CG12_big_fil_rev_8_21_14_0_65_60_17]|nr:MAG: nitrous oxide reductase [Bacteroidetes bacterium CG12_big_fil_rev_8_21_14_0_65_60_17]
MVLILVIWGLLQAASVPERMPGHSAGTISERIAAAAPHDTVHVEAGVYTEPTIVIDRPLTLLGAPGAHIQGTGGHELLVLAADSISVSGFTFSGVDRTFMEDRAAIRVQDARGCRIANNTFRGVFFGIYMARATDCHIESNTLRSQITSETTGGNAVHAWYSTHLTIANNRIDGFRDGIYLEFTDDSRVEGNTSVNNLRYGLHFMFADRNAYTDNVFSDNRAGVAVMYADGISMQRNVFRRAWGASAYGLLLKEIRRGEVLNNTFDGNSVALLVESTDHMTFHGNTFAENGWGIKLMASAIGNVFSDNTFRGNTFDVSTNSRTLDSRFEGNFWDTYKGYDLDRDGRGDVAHRPVTLFSVLVERHEPVIYLHRSLLVDVLNVAERLLPVLTPVELVDPQPRMRPPL